VSLFRDFKGQDKQEIIAARITGPARSAFAEAPPTEGDAPEGTYLAETKQSIQVVVVADSDLLADRFWTQSSSFLGESFVVPMADNANFVVNALENLTGSPALSSLRGRGVQSRPFELLDSLRQEAEMQYRQFRPAAETDEFYFAAASERKSVWSFVRQLRGPHLST
jgi:ABC-type uncharacterized transport system involved in gliding motility auxiliary subunit